MTKIEKLKSWIDKSRTLVVFTGAGISVPSGIPDFRSSKDRTFEEVLTYRYMEENPDLFTKYIFSKLYHEKAQPNIAHLYLKELEDNGKLTQLVTQNIDGLDQMAGIKKVYPIHGSIHEWYCMNCERKYNPKDLFKDKANYCSCGGFIRPNVTLYGEALDETYYHLGLISCQVADLLIVIGSSLSVNPAASMVKYYAGSELVIINKDKTKLDSRADLVIHKDIEEVIKELKELESK